MRTLVLSVVILSLIPFSLFASARSDSGGLPERVAELEAQVEVLAAALQEAQEILQFVRVETEEMDGLAGPHWIIEGANVHVRSGLGQTYPRNCPSGFPDCISSNHLGNLIVGYNELPPSEPPFRPGMHNLVVGPEHDYPGSGGFVAGRHNSVWNRSASVTGGIDNVARSSFSSVSGGNLNVASGDAASVSGGHHNLASGPGASVSGGHRNEASGLVASVSGGQGNKASGVFASVSGGFRNEANGDWASVSGGQDGEAPDNFNWVAGDLFEPN